jgi:hypothetical protein
MVFLNFFRFEPADNFPGRRLAGVAGGAAVGPYGDRLAGFGMN